MPHWGAAGLCTQQQGLMWRVRMQLMPETLFLTANLIDRFLEKKRVSRRNLQLVHTLQASWRPCALRILQPPPTNQMRKLAALGMHTTVERANRRCRQCASCRACQHLTG